MQTNKTGIYHPTLAGEKTTFALDLSENGLIDCKKYSLLEVLYDERLQGLTLQERIEILNSFVDDMKAVNHYSYRREITTGCDAMVKIKEAHLPENRTMVNLSSNDYLNLSQHPRVKKAVIEATMQYGVGIGCSPMFNGTSSLHRKLEQKIAAFKGCEEAMVFSSGYGANLGTLRALLTDKDAAICDMYAHASLMDGCTHTNRFYFKHNDARSLERVLQKAGSYQNKLVIVDGVYSMDGDIANLDQIVALAHKYGAWVLVDDAHGVGVIGEKGKGTPAYFNLSEQVDLVTGTFSKSLGAIGGFVAGKKDLIGYLQVACRAYMFSTSPPMPVMAGVLEALHVIEEEPEIMENLHSNIQYFRSRIVEMGFNIGESKTAIIPLIIGNDTRVKEMTYRLHQAGILANAVPYPAVPKKLTRVRITLSAGNTKKQLDYALQEIKRIGMELEIIPPEKFKASDNNKIGQTQVSV